ncbi:MAG: M48 family metalloprotease [Spirochaetaceae bacterium]|jgi:predicted Zn-dependent protease|nr:M48 family metalloprotease [Spirochaetaceae bacterium]
MKKLLILAGFTAAVLASCQSVSDAIGVTAGGAGDAGIISQDLADAGVRFSEDMDRAQEDFTPEQEYYIGRAVGTQILTKYSIDASRPDQAAYLNNILQALAVNSPKPDIYNGYHAVILDSDEINAFATSGGHIFISRALLGSAASEDALASVLAHELAHIQLQHNVKAIQADRKARAIRAFAASSTGALTGGTALEELTSIFDESISDAFITLIGKGYSRDQEYDADTAALGILAAAGYDPASLLDMLRVLDQEQPNHPGGFNETHPAPRDRLNNANRRLGAYSAPDTRAFRRARFSAAQ